MTETVIPRFEPEVIAAGARRRNGDADKVSTTMLGSLNVLGVTVSSRYSKAIEIEAMAGAVRALSTALREPVRTPFCDSKASTYEITLGPCNPLLARWIGETIGQHLVHRHGGHCGIYVKTAGGHEIEIGSEADAGDVE